MYRFFPPAKALDPFVECYWTLHTSRAQELELTERIFVDGRADLIFNFGCPYRREISGQPERNRLVACSNLDAPRDHPVFIVQQGEIHLTGVRFKPGGLEARLFDCLERPEAQAGLRQASLLDETLLGRLEPGRKNELALHLARQITDRAGQIDLRRLSREIGYSPRHMDRIFQQCFGISPKFQARIARFQKALRLLVASPGIELVEIVAACGYYNQAHLSKEFAEFAGQSPNQHRAHLIGKMAGATPPNLVQFLQDL